MDLNKSDPSKLLKLNSLSDKITKLGSSNLVSLKASDTNSVFLEQITEGIAQKKHLIIRYNSLIKDKKTSRKIDPQSIYFLNGNLYLSAFDLDVKADRVFKVELIEDCEVVYSNAHDNAPIQTQLFDVVLDVKKSHRNFIERNSSVISAMQEFKDRIEVNIQISNLEWLKRSILSNAPGISIKSPIPLANELLESATSVLALYRA